MTIRAREPVSRRASSVAAASYGLWVTTASGRKLRRSLAMRNGSRSQNEAPLAACTSSNRSSRPAPSAAVASTRSSSSSASASHFCARLTPSGSR